MSTQVHCDLIGCTFNRGGECSNGGFHSLGEPCSKAKKEGGALPVKKEMTLKITVRNPGQGKQLASILAANGLWVKETTERTDKPSYGCHSFFVLVKGEFEVVE